MKKLTKSNSKVLALLALICSATMVTATPITPVTVGPGNSWVVSWWDTSGGQPIDEIRVVIVSGPSTFDAPVVVGLPGWPTTATWTSTITDAQGPANGSDRVITLSFSDPMPAGGVVIDVFEMYQGQINYSGASFEFENLPGQSQWHALLAPGDVSVPDGGSTLALIGSAVMAIGLVRSKFATVA